MSARKRGPAFLHGPWIDRAIGRIERHLPRQIDLRRDLGPVTRALAFYAGLSLLVLWPLVSVAATELAGDPRSDGWKHAWGCWWYFHSLRSGGGPFPTATTLLGFPEGGSLYNIDPLNSALSIPLQVLLPLPLAWNLIVAFDLIAGATAAWMLARHAGGASRSGALLAGAVYAFCPFVLSYSLASGVGETLNLAWMPLFLITLMRLPRASLWNAGLSGALLGITAISCWYYGIFAILWTALWGIFMAARLARRAGARQMGARLRGLLPHIAIFIIVFADVVSPPLIGFWMSMRNPDSQHPGYISVRDDARKAEYLKSMDKNAAAVSDFVAVGKARAVVGNLVDRLVKSAYVGFIPILFVLIAAFGRRDPAPPKETGPPVPLGFWALSAALFATLSLGPEVHFVRAGGESVANPVYETLYRTFPGFKQIAIPYRFCVPLMLAVGVMASAGLTRLTLRVQPGRARAVAAGVSALVVLEFLLVSPAPHPLPTSKPERDTLNAFLAASQTRAVLDLPADWIAADGESDELLPGIYFYNQTRHGKSIPYRVSGRMSGQVEGNALVATVRAFMHPDTIRLPRQPDASTLRRAAEELRALGFGAIVLHEQLVQPSARAKVSVALKSALGDPTLREDGQMLWVIPAAAGETRTSAEPEPPR